VIRSTTFNDEAIFFLLGRCGTSGSSSDGEYYFEYADGSGSNTVSRTGARTFNEVFNNNRWNNCDRFRKDEKQIDKYSNMFAPIHRIRKMCNIESLEDIGDDNPCLQSESFTTMLLSHVKKSNMSMDDRMTIRHHQKQREQRRV
jgi:hypothetical protein